MFDNFDPVYFKKLRTRALTGKPNPDLIRAIAEAEERSAQAELAIITGEGQRAFDKFRLAKLKGGTK
jgi:hypothetical protein